MYTHRSKAKCNTNINFSNKTYNVNYDSNNASSIPATGWKQPRAPEHPTAIADHIRPEVMCPWDNHETSPHEGDKGTVVESHRRNPHT